MLGFPVPYPNELIYSLVARAGVHSGAISPKQLLDEVYGDRKVIATVDLPSHLAQISRQYPSVLNITTASLIYQHTLFPIYAPFIEERKRQAGMRWMANKSKGIMHLAFGIAASIVKQPKLLRYCPQCFGEQLAQYGERYWMRAWQVPGPHGAKNTQPRCLNFLFNHATNIAMNFMRRKQHWMTGQYDIIKGNLYASAMLSNNFCKWNLKHRQLFINGAAITMIWLCWLVVTEVPM